MADLFGKTLRSNVTSLFMQDGPHDANVGVASGLDARYADAYEKYYASLNPWLIAGSEMIRPGRIHTGEMLVENSDLIKTEYYADFLQPQRMYHALNVCLLAEGSAIANLSTFRPRSAKPYSHDIRLTEVLTPHFQQALGLYRRLAALRTERHFSEAALERLRVGVVLFDTQARIMFLSDAARSLLARHEGLRLELADRGFRHRDGAGSHRRWRVEAARLRRRREDRPRDAGQCARRARGRDPGPGIECRLACARKRQKRRE